ncbi:ATP-binding protein [Kitasatospora sp. McL0602]|uniref:ATP-binding protein n=1 Tax=Kitasatospora sp. McL0602 TaxID=3439530 RepID=UPI003F886268
MEQISGAAESVVRRPSAVPVEGVWRFSAVAHEAAVPQTRHAVRDRLLAQGMAGQRYQELIDDVLLIVSELVSNAVTHAAVLSPYLTAELSIAEGWVRISVEDGHPYRPRALESDLGQLGGRGLLLVKSVTLQAGGVCDVERTGEGGKIIWASLPMPTADGYGDPQPFDGAVEDADVHHALGFAADLDEIEPGHSCQEKGEDDRGVWHSRQTPLQR